MVKKEKKVTRIDPVRTTQPLEQTQEKRVCAYCRISTDSEDQKHSLEAQVAYYSRLIGERNNWIFSGIYADEDRSGTKLNGRDEFQKMMQDCRRGQHDYIITKSVTRFARNTVDSIQAIRELKALGIGICDDARGVILRHERHGRRRIVQLAIRLIRDEHNRVLGIALGVDLA